MILEQASFIERAIKLSDIHITNTFDEKLKNEYKNKFLIKLNEYSIK